MDCNHFCSAALIRIEQQLDKLIPETSYPYKALFQAARYSLLSGGKRLRPLLALATTQVMQGNLDVALIPACALELVHTYSLIHDDLPCMDDDDFRRGKPTLHKVVSEGQAVLAGDYLLTYAFETIVQAPGLSAEQRLKLIALLGEASGGHGMIAGQVMDLNATNQQVDLQVLRLIHRKKTGAIITASVLFGGIIANATDENLTLLRQFGEEIGLAFQIVDDILDVTMSEQKHGRAVASDVVNAKSTYVALLGLDQAKKTAHEHLQAALRALDSLPNDTQLLKALANQLVCRKI